MVQSTHPEGLQARKILEMKNDQLLCLKSKWWILDDFGEIFVRLPYKVMKPNGSNRIVWQGSAPSGPWWLPDHTQRAKAAEAARAETGNPEDLGNAKYTRTMTTLSNFHVGYSRDLSMVWKR